MNSLLWIIGLGAGAYVLYQMTQNAAATPTAPTSTTPTPAPIVTSSNGVTPVVTPTPFVCPNNAMCAKPMIKLGTQTQQPL